jgi:hypothetical protein
LQQGPFASLAPAPLAASFDNFVINQQPIITDAEQGADQRSDPKPLRLTPARFHVETRGSADGLPGTLIWFQD